MARTATARKRDPDSPGAGYNRAYRERIEAGIVLVKVSVYESDLDLFTSDGLLDGWCRDDREAIADAVRTILDRYMLEKATEDAKITEDNGQGGDDL